MDKKKNICDEIEEDWADLAMALLLALAFVVTTTLAVVFFTGCSHNIEGYSCKCDCENSKFECNGKERILETKSNP